MQPTRILFIAALLLLVQACAPVPPKPVRPSPEIVQGMASAAALVAEGELLDAAASYRKLAQDAPSPVREDLLLRAADALLRAGEAASAEALLTGIDTSGLPTDYRWRHRLLHGRAAREQGRPEEALQWLGPPLPAEAPLELHRSYHQERAEALRSTGHPLESARELAQLSYWLDDPEEKLDVQLALIDQLTSVPANDLVARQPSSPDDFAGWMQLALILRTAGDGPEAAAPDIWAWRASFPNHPALEELPDAWSALVRSRSYHPSRIAVLLPEDGRFQRVASALRDGILAAYFSQPLEQRPELRFFDTSHGAGIWPLVQQAVAEGAELVLGPLHKDAVAQLAGGPVLPVPVLALNQVATETQTPENLYQFALAPEDEAEQAADQASQQGYSRALVLTPDDEWGERLYQSFRTRWEALGGRVVERGIYDPKEHDFSVTLRSLLNLDESEERRQQMQRLLARNLNFEPRRRRDAEFVFLAARPQQGRAIRPQLQFHHAADLPVIATSHIYTGQYAVADRDLEGVSFPDVPWLFGATRPGVLSRERLAAVLPSNDDRFARVTAMGIDSYNLIPFLPRLKANPQETFDGMTGELSVDASNLVHRRLIWARFRDGVPGVLDAAKPDGAIAGPVGSPSDARMPPAPAGKPESL
jgi:outer membrane PBP1 activator LpoA protein